MSTYRAVLSCWLLLLGNACVERRDFTPYTEPPVPLAPHLRMPPNNSYQGSVHAGVLRPAFRWEPVSWDGPDSVTYEVTFSTDRDFSSGVTTVRTTATSHQPVDNLPVSSIPPVGARYFWRVRACIEEHCSQPSRTWWVNLGRTERDLNGDGYADVAVSSGNGQLYVFQGGPGSSIDATPDTVLARTASRRTFFATYAGDLNGDGFSDIAIDTRNPALDTALFTIYFGGPGPQLDPVPDGTYETRYGFEAAGDVNGDGYDDLIMPGNGATSGKTEIVLGAAGSTFRVAPVIVGSRAGHAVRIGDVNGDGLADIAMTSPANVAVFFGGDTLSVDGTPSGIITTSGAHDTLLIPTGSAGDVNGDGFADIVTGNPYDDVGGTDAGRAYVYFGGRGDQFEPTADVTLPGLAPGYWSGYLVTGLGDLNGDGYDDVGVASSHGNPTVTKWRGSLLVYFGGRGATMDTIGDGTLVGADFTWLATDIAHGDTNGDGFQDLLVSAPGDDTAAFNAGRVYLYRGGAGPALDTFADGVLSGEFSEDLFGDIALHQSDAAEVRSGVRARIRQLRARSDVRGWQFTRPMALARRGISVRPAP